MIRKVKVLLAFLRLSVAEKISYGANVIAKLIANASVFTSPDVTPADLQLKNDELQAAKVDAAGGDKQKVAVMHNVEKEWELLFRKDANYVNRIADGDEAVIRLGGFDPTKAETTPSHQLSAPDVKVESTSTMIGIASVECEPFEHEHVENYVYVVATNPEPLSFPNGQISIGGAAGVVAVKVDTHRKTTIIGLTSKERYYITVFGVNEAGPGLASEPYTVTIS
ncbi:MAG: fibronectin type III domain-containing protein [Bacteroidetes bacterium]|nr:fibronectin type III domain-containing protein [Bacteroidota bacterium]